MDKKSVQYRQTVGGSTGHWLRRLIHVLMLLLPYIYYTYAQPVAAFLNMGVTELLGVILLVTIINEGVRLRMALVVVGQRKREARRISSLTWGVLSVVVVFLLVPGGYANGIQYALPLIATLAIADPLMGELRRRKAGTSVVFLAGWLIALIIWAAACYYYQLSWVYILVLPVISVLAEMPNLTWIDDNALLLWAPLLVILILHGWL